MLWQESLLDGSEKWAGFSGRALAGSRTLQALLLYVVLSLSLTDPASPQYIETHREAHSIMQQTGTEQVSGTEDSPTWHPSSKRLQSNRQTQGWV